MRRFPLAALAVLTVALVVLAACAPPEGSAVGITVGTVMPVTVIIGGSPGPTLTPGPPTSTPTPIPSLTSGLTPTEVRYRLLDQYPDFFYCDPDYYPVARADELSLARQRFPDLQANTEEFQAILQHDGLAGTTNFSDEQMLVIYRDYKKLAAIPLELVGDRYRFVLRIAPQTGQALSITGLIDGAGHITVEQQTPTIATCPICLAADTRIDTPQGAILVPDLKVGQLVWTTDLAGARVAAPILRVARVLVPAEHQMVHLVLSDGRQLWASPGHPTADGRRLADLKAGDSLDGASVTLVESVLYDQPATYDLLPAGPTGFYWADGILMGSTLAGR